MREKAGFAEKETYLMFSNCEELKSSGAPGGIFSDRALAFEPASLTLSTWSRGQHTFGDRRLDRAIFGSEASTGAQLPGAIRLTQAYCIQAFRFRALKINATAAAQIPATNAPSAAEIGSRESGKSRKAWENLEVF